MNAKYPTPETIPNPTKHINITLFLLILAFVRKPVVNGLIPFFSKSSSIENIYFAANSFPPASMCISATNP